MSSVASAPAEGKQVCHETGEHHQQSTQQVDTQQHTAGCSDKDTNCQQQCTDCVHCPAVSVIPNDVYKSHVQGLQYLYTAIKHFSDIEPHSLQFRPPRV